VKFVLILFLCVGSGSGYAVKFPEMISPKQAQTIADSLSALCGANKHVPQKFHDAFYTALSGYPELIPCQIQIVERKIKSTMAARPGFGSALFRVAAKRKYKVFVNAAQRADAPLVDAFSLNAQIGIFAHELAHFLHYLEIGRGGLMKDAVKYGNDEFKSVFERATDSVAIARGFGWQCYDFAMQLKNNPDVPDEYKESKKKFYLNPEEIFLLMQQIP
jgi:hypothetical protein